MSEVDFDHLKAAVEGGKPITILGVEYRPAAQRGGGQVTEPKVRVLRLIEYVYDNQAAAERDMAHWQVASVGTKRVGRATLRSAVLPTETLLAETLPVDEPPQMPEWARGEWAAAGDPAQEEDWLKQRAEGWLKTIGNEAATRFIAPPTSDPEHNQTNRGYSLGRVEGVQCDARIETSSGNGWWRCKLYAQHLVPHSEHGPFRLFPPVPEQRMLATEITPLQDAFAEEAIIAALPDAPLEGSPTPLKISAWELGQLAEVSMTPEQLKRLAHHLNEYFDQTKSLNKGSSWPDRGETIR